LCSFYGATLAETNLGKALKDIPREKFVLSTKVGRYGQDVFDFSAERVTRSVDESLARLNVDYIDIIQCHDIEYGSLDQVSSSREKVVLPAGARVVIIPVPGWFSLMSFLQIDTSHSGKKAKYFGSIFGGG
jgi:aryl-alcohol dehydrogenase-like predicted oxidoreductase